MDADTQKAIENVMDTMVKQKVIVLHKQAITPPSQGSPYWSTYFVPEGGKRKRIRAKTEYALYQKLYPLYYRERFLTLAEAYEKWQEYRHTLSLSPRTLKRENQRWERYFRDTPMAEKQLCKIDEIQLEESIYQIISFYQPKAKELQAILSILRGIFKYAYKRRMIDANPMDRVEINKAGCAPATPRGDRSRIYTTSEQKTMLDACGQELKDHPENPISLAIMLNFQLGLRIGELAALKVSDVDFNNHTIHIQRMETKDEHDRPLIVDHLKKKSRESNRILPLSNYDLDLIKKAIKIKQIYHYEDNGENYIFVDQGGRVEIRAIDNRIRKLCKAAGLPAKSCHDIRRTVASRLHRNGLPIEKIRAYLGHSNIGTTWSYIYDVDDVNETNRQILMALSM
ncbi:MAG: tyrosine-type recombinase/integrase [Bilifractor sp.]